MKYTRSDWAAVLSRYSGVTHLLQYLPPKPVLLVLNYHRIGNPFETPYDHSVFSATAEDFDRQLRFLKKRTRVVTLDEAVDAVESSRRSRYPTVLLTFDDGYLDNYQTAFPILSSHSLQATFFLPTAFIGTNHFPWWDKVAFMVKSCRRRSFSFGTPPVQFNIDTEGVVPVLDRIYTMYKRAPAGGEDRFLSDLENACQSCRPGSSERVFINWDEALKMVQGGMAIGSHTHNHPMLGKLPKPEQARELATSRQILEQRLGIPVHTVAYPNGTKDAFNADTFAGAEETGYRAGFSFYGGFNLPGSIERFDIRRVPVGYQTGFSRFQLQTSVAMLTAKHWV